MNGSGCRECFFLFIVCSYFSIAEWKHFSSYLFLFSAFTSSRCFCLTKDMKKKKNMSEYSVWTVNLLCFSACPLVDQKLPEAKWNYTYSKWWCLMVIISSRTHPDIHIKHDARRKNTAYQISLSLHIHSHRPTEYPLNMTEMKKEKRNNNRQDRHQSVAAEFGKLTILHGYCSGEEGRFPFGVCVYVYFLHVPILCFQCPSCIHRIQIRVVCVWNYVSII